MNIKIDIKQNRTRDVGIFLLLFPFIISYGIAYYISFIPWQAYTYVSLIILVFNYLKKSPTIDILLCSELIFGGCLFFSALLNREDISNSITFFIPIIGITLWCKLFLSNSTVCRICRYYNWTIIITYIFLIVFPEGISQDKYGNIINFLGTKNTVFEMVILSLALTLAVRMKKVSIIYIVYACIAHEIINLMVQTSTAIVLISVYCLLCLVLQTDSLKKFLNYKVLLGIVVVVGIAILSNNVRFINGLVQQLFNKDVTFSNRTVLWAQALLVIKENWLVGYGYGSSIVNSFTLIGQQESFSAHNMFLQILLSMGVCGLVAFVFMVCAPIKKLRSNKVNNTANSIYLQIGLFTYLIYYFFEARSNINHFILLLAILYYWSNIKSDNRAQSIRYNSLS